VATLTEANSRLVRQLEDRSNEFKEVKALLKKEWAERKGQRTFNHSPENYCCSHGYKVAKSNTCQSCNYQKGGQKHEATKDNNMGGSQANKEWCVGATSLNNSEKFEDCRTPPLLEHHETAINDSGCIGHFLLINAPCRNKVKSQNPFTVIFPNGYTMDSTHTSSLEIPELSQSASVAHFFPGMANHDLLSVENMCNEGYYVTFRIDGVTIYNSAEKAIFKGQRAFNTGLCRINFRPDKPHLTIDAANNVYELGNTGELTYAPCYS
jgi:hypothetical protein